MIWEILSIFGDLKFWIVVSVIFLISALLKKKKLASLLLMILLSVILARSIVEILKQIFKISRPCIGLDFCSLDYSFPSGHASVIFAAVTALILQKKDWRYSILLLFFASLVSLSRIMLELHRWEDVIVGSIIGIASAVFIQILYKKFIHGEAVI